MSTYIKYRDSSAVAVNSGSDSVKGSALTNLELDANFKSISVGKAEANGSNATGTWSIGISGLAATATKFASPVSINGVSFDGSASISVNLVNAATFNSGGAGAASGSAYTGSGAITVSYNTLGAAPANNPTFTGTVTLPSTTAIGNVTSAEIAYLDGVTSAVQTQLNSKVPFTAADGSAVIPVGTTATRDGSPLTGYFRFNTSNTKFEGYNGLAWGSVGGGATGGGADEVFIENSQAVTTNYTIPASRNAMTTGPITVNSGVIVTVSSGSRWVIL